MCGIFGVLASSKSSYPAKTLQDVLYFIAKYSESRGKDSSGMSFYLNRSKEISVIKGDYSISHLLKSKVYLSSLKRGLSEYNNGDNFISFGHTRLVTNGTQLKTENNQPVIKDGLCVIHNGIITNVDQLWNTNADLKREYLIDTEIIPSMIRRNLACNDLVTACEDAFSQIEGTFSLGMMFNDLNQFVLATNNGSLYYIADDNGFIAFTSEKYFLQELLHCSILKREEANFEIRQLRAGEGIIVNTLDLSIARFDSQRSEKMPLLKHVPFEINCKALANINDQKDMVIDSSIYVKDGNNQKLRSKLEYNIDAIRHLKRCKKCLLPETFPFIEFDENGECNYCKHYKPMGTTKSLDELNEIVKPYRRSDGTPDCIVPFSGGRDSTYTLHIVKNELDLHPIAFTYDWGMVTDLGRRNIARVCGKLGVENIIISADVRWKRNNIRKNIQAWLHHPLLGMIPLFMAGDKYFFYYCNQIKRDTGIDLNIWGINHLENTNFKVGFEGIAPNFEKETIYSLSTSEKLKLFSYIAKNTLANPRYINSSVLDSLGSFVSRYISPKKDYYHLFDYYKWDENEINDLLVKEYNWELAKDSPSTWRIGDGTAAFYNYIYYTVAGFSEYDTFRSNQIREGMIDRETALRFIEEENKPRFESLRWYLDILNLDFSAVIDVINRIPKLYKM